jgi:hypothetical protein
LQKAGCHAGFFVLPDFPIRGKFRQIQQIAHNSREKHAGFPNLLTRYRDTAARGTSQGSADGAADK